jgi:hypothetical protein
LRATRAQSVSSADSVGLMPVPVVWPNPAEISALRMLPKRRLIWCLEIPALICSSSRLGLRCSFLASRRMALRISSVVMAVSLWVLIFAVKLNLKK